MSVSNDSNGLRVFVDWDGYCVRDEWIAAGAYNARSDILFGPDRDDLLMSETASARTEPLLRTLSPALRGLEKQLRSWLNTTHRFPMSTLQKAGLEGLTAD